MRGRPLLGPGLAPDTIRSPEQPVSDVYDQGSDKGDIDDADTLASSLHRQEKWSSPRGNANVVTSLSPSSGRAPKVVGSFDHAILPMPPVRSIQLVAYDYSLLILYRERLSFLRWIFSRAMLSQ
jgi:hypothetical protein